MVSPPGLFEVPPKLDQAYIEAVQLAGEYAHGGRGVVVAKMRDIRSSVHRSWEHMFDERTQ
jgi:hypothetical protein